MKLIQSDGKWKFLGSCGDGQKFEVNRINVWNYKWQSQNGPKATVKDPS